MSKYEVTVCIEAENVTEALAMLEPVLNDNTAGSIEILDFKVSR